MRRLGHCGFVVSLVVPGTAIGSRECRTDAYIIAIALYSFQHISSRQESLGSTVIVCNGFSQGYPYSNKQWDAEEPN